MSMMEHLYRICNESEQIIIYGAGTISNIMYLYLKAKGFENKVKCFCVTERKNNPSEKYGFQVLEAKEAVERYSEALVLLAVQKVLQATIGGYLCDLNCRTYEAVDSECLIDNFYKELYKDSIQSNKIIFSNMKNMGYGGNPKYIAEKLIEYDTKSELDLVWVVADKRYHIPERIRTVEFGSYEYYRELATARVWIDNTRKNFDARKRSGQYYIQAWHGAAPIKKVEKDVEATLPEIYIVNAKKDSRMADLFLSGSRFYTQLYRKSFWYDGDIFEAGLPRQDIFWHSEGIRKKICDYYGISEECAIVLYAPTFRNDFTNKYYDLDFEAVLEALERKFQKKFVLCVSKHPDNRFLEYDFKGKAYIAVEEYEDFEELLVAADILITDYSGCMYDFSYTQRPVFLYQNDYQDYQHERNFYIPMEEMPYIRAQSNDELLRKIEQFDAAEYKKELHKFMDRMGNFDDGHASEKVAKHILKILNRGIE